MTRPLAVTERNAAQYSLEQDERDLKSFTTMCFLIAGVALMTMIAGIILAIVLLLT